MSAKYDRPGREKQFPKDSDVAHPDMLGGASAGLCGFALDLAGIPIVAKGTVPPLEPFVAKPIYQP